MTLLGLPAGRRAMVPSTRRPGARIARGSSPSESALFILSPSSARVSESASLPIAQLIGDAGGECSEHGRPDLAQDAALALSVKIPRQPHLISGLASPIPPHIQHAHARFLSWFLDALAAKAAGKDVGMWFGPSMAAGASRWTARRVETLPACSLGVSVATHGTLHQTEVFAVSHSSAFAPSSLSAASVSSHGHSLSHESGSKKGKESKSGGDRPVLLLLRIRLAGRC
ncbi:hypothetical protein DFH09DRAFT_1322587 [Mycena vulgaris]|nr:hypothetical protein DFH09DRAFT_1322587 [Mycena vulgaris]